VVAAAPMVAAVTVVAIVVGLVAVSVRERDVKKVVAVVVALTLMKDGERPK
jgi:hypothetical protein